jgi:hypothetical protein
MLATEREEFVVFLIIPFNEELYIHGSSQSKHDSLQNIGSLFHLFLQVERRTLTLY